MSKWCKYLVLASISSTLIACGASSESPEPDHADPERNTSDYLAYMKSAYSEQLGLLSNEDGLEELVTPIPIVVADDSSASADYFSGTNVQIAGVDEADTLKFDGDNMLWLSISGEYDDISGYQSTATVYSFAEGVLNGDEAEDTSLHFSPDSNYNYEGLLGNNEQTALVGSSSYWFGGYGPDIFISDAPFCAGSCLPFTATQPEVIAYTWDYAQSATPLIPDPHTVKIEGSLFDTRLIGDQLYIISQYSPQIDYPYPYPLTDAEKAENQALIDSLSIDEVVPQISINGNQDRLFDGSECTIAASSSDSPIYPNVISITQIDMTTPTTWQSSCYLGNVSQAFVSLNNVYLSRGIWSENRVELVKYALTETGPEYRASGSVDGSLNGDSYYFGEIDGKLTFVNTVYDPESWWFDGLSFNHQLSVFEENGDSLDLVSQIPNESSPTPIGKPGERIYAVRFLGERAYIVTFDKVDPLYVINLSTPEQPEILGELEIPGFSSYIHVINDELVLGIGKNATEQGGTTWYQGLNIRLFDVSDPTQPLALESLDYGLRGSESAALYDPHAFTFVHQAESNVFRFAVPMVLHGSEETFDPTAHPRTFYDWEESGLYQFEVTTGDSPSIQEVGRFNIDQQYFYQQTRSVINNERIYFANDNQLDVIDWGGNTSLRRFSASGTSP